MTPRFARRLTLTYLVAYAVAVTWPGMVPFNRVHPLVLGLPFNMVWIAVWIVGGCLVLAMLYLAETAERKRRSSLPSERKV